MQYSQVPLEKAVPYACEDADITLMAREILAPGLAELGLDELMTAVEMPLVPVLMRMEMRGAGIDIGKLRELSRSFKDQLDALEGILSIGGSQIPQAAPFLERLKRTEFDDGQTLTLTLDASLIPLDAIEDEEGREGIRRSGRRSRRRW